VARGETNEQALRGTVGLPIIEALANHPTHCRVRTQWREIEGWLHLASELQLAMDATA
jgi:hypothetical protein